MNYSIPLPTKLEIAMLHGGHMTQIDIAFATQTSVNRIINMIIKLN